MSLTKSGLIKIQQTEFTLERKRYRCVWTKTDQGFPFDRYESLWAHPQNGKSFMICLSSIDEGLDALSIQELVPIKLEEVAG